MAGAGNVLSEPCLGLLQPACVTKWSHNKLPFNSGEKSRGRRAGGERYILWAQEKCIGGHPPSRKNRRRDFE